MSTLFKSLMELPQTHTPHETLPLRALSRMAISSSYPLDATPPSELFDLGETVAAIITASAVIQILKRLDQD